MYVKKIHYTDYNGNERDEEFLFNLTRSEVIKLNFSKEGGLEEYAHRLSNSLDPKEILDTFETLILTAYGEKSPDGRRFVKSEEISEAFSQTPAYDQMFMEFMSDTSKAVEFFNGVIPKDVLDAAIKAEKEQAKQLESKVFEFPQASATEPLKTE